MFLSPVLDICQLILKSKSMTAATDPVPTKFLLDFTDILLPVIQKIVNLSLQSGIMPEALKKVIVKLLVCSWKLPAGFKPSVLV